VKITDFGISRATGDVTVTATGMLAGTPAYLAPEVAKGYDPGSPSDVFSLGSTLYAAIEGTPPFGLSENTIALLHKVASGKVDPPRNAGPMTALLMRLLRAEPEDRPTMAEARDALAAVANGQAAAAFTPAVVAPTHPPSWRGTPVQQQPQQQAATRALTPTPPPPNATRVDLHTPPRAVPTQQQPPNHRPAAAPQYSQRPKTSTLSSVSSKSKKSTVYTALAIVAAAVIGIMFASMISNNKDKGGGDNNAGGNTQVQQTNDSTKPSTPQKSAGKAGQWTSQPSSDDMRSFLNDYFGTAPSSPEEAWKMGNGNFQSSYPGGYAAFQDFWNDVKSTKIVSANEVSEYYWEVTVEYTKKTGGKTTEKRGISFQWASPQFLLSSDKTLGG
ncbi:hypothetical protein UK23_03605, partial [Lentzea aerocolonigenes]